MMKLNKSDILQALETITLPGEGENMVTSGAVTNVMAFADEVIVDITMATPAMHIKKRAEADIIKTIQDKVFKEAKVQVNITVAVPEKPSNPNLIKGKPIPGIKNIVAIASGKGGVGKSTVSVNLALTLYQKGYKVSLFDADIYGPSLPIMTGRRGEKPAVIANRLIPLESFGINTMSIGNLVEENDAVIWRGPMVHQALEQLLRDTKWPGGDFMIIDFPPGTGDVQLSLSQLCEFSGAIIVSTPQDVALIDAIKAAQMFSKVEIDILGIIENMSFFTCPKCGEETPIFSRHGAEEASKKLEVPFLGAIPIELQVRKGGDEGKPLMASNLDSPATAAFKTIADNLVKVLEGA